MADKGAGKEMDKKADDQKDKLEGLPVDTSPYTQYTDLEDYKKQGYGTKGHLQPEPGRGAGSSTDAPTLSGGSTATETQHLSSK